MSATSASEYGSTTAVAVTTPPIGAGSRRADGNTFGLRHRDNDFSRCHPAGDELDRPRPDHPYPTDGVYETATDSPHDPSNWAGAEDGGLGAPDRHTS